MAAKNKGKEGKGKRRGDDKSGAASKPEAGRIVDLLIASYNAEIETVMSYLANSVNLDGIRAKHIKASLAADVTEELGHAQQLAARIKILGGLVPGSFDLRWTQRGLQPNPDTTDVVSVIRGVIEAEDSAIVGYERLVRACEGVDPVTQDLAITLLADEQEHRREFVGFLKEIEAEY